MFSNFILAKIIYGWVDKMFKQLSVEQSVIYRKTFRAVYKSQQSAEKI